MKDFTKYEVIIIGAGHAGIESAAAASRLGASTLLLTISLDSIGLMPCNSAIGGPGRGQLVREIDALGGIIGQNADKNYLHNRIINTSKGLAIRTIRSVVDKRQYFISVKKQIEKNIKLDIRQGLATEIKGKNDRLIVKTSDGMTYTTKSVVIATGTFLRGKIFWGDYEIKAGRLGEINSIKMANSLEESGISFGRLRTETPPRVDRKTIDINRLRIQKYDTDPEFFSDIGGPKERKQMDIFYTYIDSQAIEFIQKNIKRSTVYGGDLESHSPKYCPSIEDKVTRFKNKERYPIFIQPEGKDTNEMYLHGMHTTFSESMQEGILRKISGLEDAIITRPGYGVEYDYLIPGQINHSLESKRIKGVFFAGQINGTTGYEEAAAQGILAGINAARKAKNQKIIQIDREDGYIGVMVDDIVTKGVSEPYRMLTSKNEYRLIHRHDNSKYRMSKYLRMMGMEKESRKIEEEKMRLDQIREDMKDDTTKINRIYHLLREKDYKNEIICSVLKKYKVNISDLRDIIINIEYQKYIERDNSRMQSIKEEKEIVIPEDIDYKKIKDISKESVEKLERERPANLLQLKKIEGVRPFDILFIMRYLKNVPRGTK